MSTALADPVDCLLLDDDLDDVERMVVRTVRSFVEGEFLPGVGGWWEEGVFPTHLIPALGELGLFGMHLEGYGGSGMSSVCYGLACRELEAGDSGLRSFVSVQGSLVMFPIHAYGSDEQKAEWLPRLATGEAIGCFGLTESDSGSDPASMRTRARRDGGDWVLDGSKMWITNGSLADVAVVWASTDEGIRGFVVPTDTPGFSANRIERKVSLRASVTSELVLDGVRLPDSAMLPGVGGLRGPLSCLSEARYGILWGAVGASRACFTSALTYAQEREQFGVPIASFQLTQRKLVEMFLKLVSAHQLAERIGRLKDRGLVQPVHISMGKLNNVRAALDIAREARTILAANGITLEYPVIRHMNNLESVLTYEGTSEIHTLVIGQVLTGHAAYR